MIVGKSSKIATVRGSAAQFGQAARKPGNALSEYGEDEMAQVIKEF